MDYLILGLATWRLTSLLVNERGPWDILERLRYLSGMRYDRDSMPYATTNLSEVLSCVWCLSVWVGIAFGLFYWLNSSLAVLISLPLALSTTAVIVDRLVTD